MASNLSLNKAKQVKNDEFYTFYDDIEKCIFTYKEYLKNKIIYCNCDNPKYSNFFKFFLNNFNNLKLKKVYFTYYEPNKTTSILTTIVKENNNIKVLKSNINNNGDYKQNSKIVKISDIIITNPPFSKFREFIKFLEDNNNKYLVIGNLNMLSTKYIFSLLKNNKIRVIPDIYPNKFLTPDNKVRKLNNVIWYTNFIYPKYDFEPTKKFEETFYKKYDNYDIINVDRIKDIPCNYYLPMGVPITFLIKYNFKKWKLISYRYGTDRKDLKIDKKIKYSRIIIQKRK